MIGVAQRRQLGIWGPQDFGVQNPAASLSSGSVNLAMFLNGWLRGCVSSDVAGTLTITQESIQGDADLVITVPQDATVGGAAFNYPFYVGMFMPWVTLTYVVGGAPTTFLRVSVTVVPET